MKDLDRKYSLYKTLIQKVQDKHGFIESKECDSLLWSGLVGTVPDIKVDIMAAFDAKKGVWHRRPSKDCWPEHSASTISRDMLLGLLAYCIKHQKGVIADQIVKHAITHFGFMGKGTGVVGLSRINIMPNLFVSYLLISN
jgi:5-methylcytosine-specific restriction endonuclease McrA